MRIVRVSLLLLWGFERGIDKPDLRIIYPRLALVLVLFDPLLSWHLSSKKLAETFSDVKPLLKASACHPSRMKKSEVRHGDDPRGSHPKEGARINSNAVL